MLQEYLLQQSIHMDNTVLWRDRRHVMWFPFSFTVYELKKDRLYEKRGFLNTSYDELLLYRIVDLSLSRSLMQRLYGTGTIILKCKGDSSSEIRLENIKNPMAVKEMFSELIEEARLKQRVVGKEFYSHDHHADDAGDFES